MEKIPQVSPQGNTVYPDVPPILAASAHESIKFAVGPAESKRSELWWIHATDDGFYVGTPLFNYMTFSFHKSGRWSLAWTHSAAQRFGINGTRIIESFRPSPESAPGRMHALSIVIPMTSLVTPGVGRTNVGDEVSYWPPLRRDEAVSFDIYVHQPNAPEATLAGPILGLVGTCPTLDGGQLAIVAMALCSVEAKNWLWQMRTQEMQKPVQPNPKGGQHSFATAKVGGVLHIVDLGDPNSPNLF